MMAMLDRIEQTPIGLIVFTIVAYLALLVLVRLSGFQTIGRLSTVGFIVAITIGTAATQALLTPDIHTFHGLIVVATLVFMEVLLARLTLYSPWLRKLVSGTPVPLIEQGKVLEGNLHRQSIDVDQLMQMLRPLQAFHLSDVEAAVLEPTGKLSVQFKSDKAPLQPSQLGLTVPPAAGLPRIVINDGTVRQEQLYALGYNETWLMQELAKRGYTNLQEIVVAQLDPAGKLYVDTVNDFRPTQPPQDKQQILAGLQKLQADLAAYAVETDDKHVRARYMADAERMAKVVTSVTPYLQG